MATFTEAQWNHPSRCAGWSNRDVVSHLDSTNTFWMFAIAAGRKGDPTQFLATFDPVATPAQLVAASSGDGSAAVLERFVANTESLVDLLTSLDEHEWLMLAEAPPGHLSISAVAHHALWDSWVHERDILLPLGMVPADETDEIVAALRYVAALGPAFAATRGTLDTGVLAIDVTDPDVSIVVDIGEQVAVRTGPADDADLRLTGAAVELLEALSLRTPLDRSLPAESSWMLRGLAETFDVAVQ